MGIRLLLVEDEVPIARFIMRGLREEGYTVEHATDGLDGWHRLTTESWDIVVLDWWLPGMDGLTILTRWRQSNALCPVLFLTARDTVADRVRGLDAGADDYLCKPFAFEEFVSRIRALLRRQDQRIDKRLTYDDVFVDLATQRVERAGNAIELKSKEYGLLVYFMRHPEEVLSRTRIYEHVWEEQYDGFSNTLEVHVVELRRKLEAFGPRLIQTIRGRGYAFRKTIE